ncbi:MAG: tRNA pseudouridine(55) synthase TruB [Acidobacteriota bacterium]
MDGVVVIDKEPGWTSHDVVAKIRNILKVKKVGHAGTLDPFATGVLPLTLGKATRLTNYFLASDKVYLGVMRFGFATDTYDVDGEPVGDRTEPVLDISKLEEIFSHYRGTIQQVLPPYSAKKIKGRPLYSYARQGIDVTPPTKTVHIKTLKLGGINHCEVEFELACSAGTYARGLAHDIGREYGCGAHLVHLRRVRSGEFPIEKAVSLRENEQFHPPDFFSDRIIPLKELLPELPCIVVQESDKKKLLNGIDLNLLTTDVESEEFRIIDESGELITLAHRVQTFSSPVAQTAHWRTPEAYF